MVICFVLKWGEDASWNRNLRLVTAVLCLLFSQTVPYCSLLLFVLGCTIHSFCHACVTSLPGKISGRRGKRSWESERVVGTLSHLILLSDCPGESSPDNDCCCLWRLMFLQLQLSFREHQSPLSTMARTTLIWTIRIHYHMLAPVSNHILWFNHLFFICSDINVSTSFSWFIYMLLLEKFVSEQVEMANN